MAVQISPDSTLIWVCAGRSLPQTRSSPQRCLLLPLPQSRMPTLP